MGKKKPYANVVPFGLHEEMMQRPYSSARILINRRFLPPGAVQDIIDYTKMNFNRQFFDDHRLRRTETRLTDAPFATIERDKDDERKIIGKYIHTPYIITEKYLTELEARRKSQNWCIFGFVTGAAIVGLFWCLKHFGII